MIKKLFNRPIVFLDVVEIVIFALLFANFSFLVALGLSFVVFILSQTLLRDK